MGTLVFVHGTGVRLKDYQRGLARARAAAADAGVNEIFMECAWGDPLGALFDGLSLPDPPEDQTLSAEELDFAEWHWLFDDPLFELDRLAQRGVASGAEDAFSDKPWEAKWSLIVAYQPTDELRLLLERAGLVPFWSAAWQRVVHDPDNIPYRAFEATPGEVADVCRALARALIAQLHLSAVDAGLPGPPRILRDRIRDRLLTDWQAGVYGLGTYFADMLKRAGTRVLRAHRAGMSRAVAFPLGDILIYQSRGAEIRELIRKKILAAKPPVNIVAHSLGGIACVDLFALPDPPKIAHLVTVGSQAPLLYEFGALFSLKPPQQLPKAFPPWLNLYDRSDFLSYVGSRLWTGVEDKEVSSGQPFPDSHSAYFGNPAVWEAIRDFIKP